MSEATPGASRRSQPAAFGAGALICTLGGLIGLGGAEFRLPLLISYFGFVGLEAAILNKAASLSPDALAFGAPGRSGKATHHRPSAGVLVGGRRWCVACS
jgi:uncharacterized membrane protein YfcA